MKITVGSVFSDSPRNNYWYDLQIKNLNFPHIVYPNCDYKFPHSTVLKRIGSGTDQQGHVEGLNELISYFKTIDSDYYLILDSDCFPVQKDWFKKLIPNLKNGVSAIVRYENLDSFAHPSAFFFKKDILKTLEFGINKVKNIVGFEFDEVTSNVKDFFPLIRTNYVNPHPIMFGIYWKMFYHHGAGSRSLKFRAINDLKYYENTEIDKLNEENFRKLISNTDEYIQYLNTGKKTIKVL